MRKKNGIRLAFFLGVALLAGCGTGAQLAAPDPPLQVAAGPCSIYRSWNTGDTLTASDLTQSLTTVGVTNATTDCIDDHSSDTTQMQATTDPYPAGSPSLATTLTGELERYRYVLKTIFGWTQWYTHSENIDFGARNITTTGTISGAVTPRSYLAGYKVSNNGTDPTNDLDIAVGTARDSTNATDLTLASALTKQTDVAWAVGTNQGCLDTGVVGNNTYHIWAIKRSDTGVVDILCSLSVSAPSMPANYDSKRRIVSIIRSGGAILAFVQDGDAVQLASPVLDVDVTNPGIAAASRTLTVPSGLRVRAHVNLYSLVPGSATLEMTYVSDLSVADLAPSATVAPLATVGGYNGPVGAFSAQATVWTNTSGQIRTRGSSNSASAVQRIATTGWDDPRGRND